MKMSFIIGWACLFVGCIFFNTVVEQSTGVSTTQWGWINSLMSPTVVESPATNFLGTITGYITLVGSYMKTLISMIFLWFPSMWTGVWYWVYIFFFLPVSVGFVVSIVIILRGGSSS
jgi:hypothetical protein